MLEKKMILLYVTLLGLPTSIIANDLSNIPQSDSKLTFCKEFIGLSYSKKVQILQLIAKPEHRAEYLKCLESSNDVNSAKLLKMFNHMNMNHPTYHSGGAGGDEK